MPSAFRTACLLGERLATLRNVARLSQSELAPLVGYSRSTIANAETGRRPAARDFWEHCDQVLDTGGVLAHQYDELKALRERHHAEMQQAARAERHARIEQLQQHPYTTWQRQPALDIATPSGLSLSTDEWNEGQSNGLAALLDEAAPLVAASTMARLVHEWLVVEPPQNIELRAGRRIGANLVSKVERRVVQLRRLDDFVGGGDLHQLVERELTASGRLLRDAAHSEHLGRRLFVAIGELCQLDGWVAADAGQYERAAHCFAAGVKSAHTAGNRPLAANLISTLAYQLSNIGSPLDGILLAQTAAGVLEHYDERRTREAALYTSWLAEAHIQAGDIDQAAALASKTATLTAHTTSARSDARLNLLRVKLEPYRSTQPVRRRHTCGCLRPRR
jgi:transcriptional regulator with XRE-family HTH domain